MQNQIEEREFTHDGNNFQLRLFGGADSYTVIAYLNNQQISLSYSVGLNTHIDYFLQHKASLVERLFEIASSDIKHGIYFRA
ncbi:MAG TPA: hypothetical protein VMV97_12150 [Sulfuriferula sp.]|nr:hypothetical protein [Sulfuriferula sp.]